jgi:HPt (histidine-containing phosphotransfer) domain-containing protein
VHSLAGSAKTFGLPAVGEAARALEDEIVAAGEPDAGPIAGRASRIAPKLEALRKAASYYGAAVPGRGARRRGPICGCVR